MSAQSTPSLPLIRIAAASRHVALVALAGAGAFVFAAHASAGAAPNQDQRVSERVVSYRDLNLSKPTDAAVLYTRLRRAADAVCGEYDNRDLSARQRHAACSSQALSDAVAQVNESQLTAVFAGDKRIRVAERDVGRR